MTSEKIQRFHTDAAPAAIGAMVPIMIWPPLRMIDSMRG